MKRIIALIIIFLGIFSTSSLAFAALQKGCSKKTAIDFNAEQSYTFCYKSGISLVPMMTYDADIKEMGIDGSPSSTVGISYYKDRESPEKVMEWMSEEFRGKATKGKSVKNKKGVIGFYYDWYATKEHGGNLIEHGVFLINKKSKDNEFVKISFNPKEKAVATLIKTFTFTGSGMVNGQPYETLPK